MRLALAMGVALAATTMVAHAQDRVFIRHPGPGPMIGEMDANHDGWITRQEASAAADRMFERMDFNHDGKLDQSDSPMRHQDIEMRVGPDGGPDGPVGAGCTRTVDPANAGASADRTVTIICNNDGNQTRRVFVTRSDGADAHAERSDSDRQVETQVIIRGPEGAMGPPGAPPVPPMPPMPPMPPHPPMMMMFLANSDEYDRNHDGALSRDEFRAQQLAFFDASDGNHDGRVRFEPPPEPPTPPMPPTPPEPPAPPR